jgi:Na+/proline symporter
VHERAVQEGAGARYGELESRYEGQFEARKNAATALAAAEGDAVAPAREELRTREADVAATRTEALALAREVTGVEPRDVNYVTPRFVLSYLPVGLLGIFIAAVLAAAMSSIAAELNSLSTATVIDFYKRWFRTEGSDAHFLFVSKMATLFWGAFACIVAFYSANLGSLIEVVNRYGSFFYGSILGVFLLAMVPWAKARGAFFGLIAGMSVVGYVNFRVPTVAFLWHNVLGALVVVIVGSLLSLGGDSRPAPAVSIDGGRQAGRA